jgi:hypothetical protein
MKQLLLTTFYLMVLVTCGQNINKQIIDVNTVEKANAYINKNPNLNAELLTISSEKDTSDIFNSLFLKKKGDVISEENFTYKIIDTSMSLSFRVSYLYLDGRKLSIKSIDSLRSVILAKYKEGTSFVDLVKEYNMDGNLNDGDLGWFKEGMVVKDFEMEVKQHKKGDIFTINVPDNKWYYVTLKTFDDRKIRTMTLLKIKSNQ